MRKKGIHRKIFNFKSILVAMVFAISLWALPGIDRSTTSANPHVRPVQDPSSCGPMDVAFIIDDTASMDSALNNVKSQLTGILNDIETASGNDYRLALVSFKDNIVVHENFAANNRASVGAKISALVAADGNSEPEASDEALNTVVNTLPASGRPQNIDFTPAFRPGALKIAILVTDARPGGLDDIFTPGVDDVNAHERAVEAAANDIKISAIYVPTFTGVSATIRAIMQDYATTSGGVFIETASNGNGTGDAIRAIIDACGGTACEINCPLNIVKSSDSDRCGTVVDFTPTTSGECSVVCDPPSGSVFLAGGTTVTCRTTDDPEDIETCSFSVTVIDSTPPRFTCPQDVAATTLPGQCGSVANYSTPVVTDNCENVTIICSPPSGSTLPVGSTAIRCIARDDTGNEATCSFSFVVRDLEPPKITCPESRAIDVSGSSCLGSVSGLTLPAATDNCSGAVRVAFTRSDGRANLTDGFSPGDTIITYLATDASGNVSAPCQQMIRVNAAPKVVVPAEVDFGKVNFLVASNKKPKKRAVTLAASTRTFAIRNEGCGEVVLTLKSISRTGEDVNNGKITNKDDSDFFSIREIGGGFKSPTGDNTIRIPSNPANASAQRKDFEIIFEPRLPERSSSNNGLSAKQALPDPFTAELVLMDAAGTTYRVMLRASVANDVRFINPEDIQRKAPFISFSRSGDIFTVEYTLYDADSGGRQANSASFVKSAKYEFLDNGGKVVQTIDVDLAGPVEDANLAKGQRFKVAKTFSGANDNPSISRVRVTVTDGAASPSLEGNLGSGPSTQSFSSAQAFRYLQDVTIYLPAGGLKEFNR